MAVALIFVVVLGILIFVHELGHFFVARRNGIEVKEFGFGFPPRIIGVYWDKSGKKRIIWGSEEIDAANTIYSINLIPLGGFVRILGEDGEQKDNKKSFAAKSAWVRTKVLFAGVGMNFIFAIAVLSLGFYLGMPQAIEESAGGTIKNKKVQIINVAKESPAFEMGLKAGDEIIGFRNEQGFLAVSQVDEVQSYINSKKGSRITISLKRGNKYFEASGVPRNTFPEGQGALGVSLLNTAEVSYPMWQAVWNGTKMATGIVKNIFGFLFDVIKKIFVHEKIEVDIAGPVGIAVVVGQAAKLGFIYILQLTALLSINLAVVNILPIPALDGGRILFIIIEKLKGSPVSKSFEQKAHSLGFALLIVIMLLITFRDISQFETFKKIRNIF